MPVIQNPGLGAGQQALLVATVNLTAAQIKTLDSVPVQLVPAPGAGKLLVPLFFVPVFSFGTRPYQFATGGSDTLHVFWEPIGNTTQVGYSNMIVGLASAFAIQSAFFDTTDIFPGPDNESLALVSLSAYTNGAIATATLGAGGAGYVANDTGTITTGSGDATYKVLTVGGGGAVLTLSITGAGTSYAVGNGQATAPGGAQPGAGAGFTVNVTAVTQGDGTLKVTTYYQIIPVP
jgi:hypothetical protein